MIEMLFNNVMFSAEMKGRLGSVYNHAVVDIVHTAFNLQGHCARPAEHMTS
jgi:hypothetical protein